MLSVRKVLAGRGAVDYYLAARRGLADYYLAERTDGETSRLYVPPSGWWGGGAAQLGLSGELDREAFSTLYGEGLQPDGSPLGRRFRLPEQAASARDAALAAAGELTDPFDRWMAGHEVKRGGSQASVAGWDCTFSPVKSVSLLWAAADRQVQKHIWAAHAAAVDAALVYLEQHAGYVRAGRNGVRVHETDGLVVSRISESTSRDGDMQLHTHCLLLNRARTRDDGRWRALDGRALLAARTGAGAIYHRMLEVELTRRLQVAWRERPDGLRELDGVDDELIAAFSTRRRAITARLEQLVEAYEQRHGHPPPPAVVSAMAQEATLSTRRRKTSDDPDAALDRWEAIARRQGRDLRRLPRQVLGRATPATPVATDGEVDRVLARIRDTGRATVTRHDVLRAALDVLDAASYSPAGLARAARQLVTSTLADRRLLTVTAPDVLEPTIGLCRSDGTSLYDQPDRQRWALRATLDEEAWLLDIAAEPSGRTPDPRQVDASIVAHHLSDDQAAATRQLLGTDRRIGLLVGPAGAGKSRALRAVADAWHQEGGEVIGLTVSQSAAEVLASEAEIRTENTAKWLFEVRRGRWQLPARPLVIVDEASMIATRELVEIVAQTRQSGGRVLLVGDPAQLAAIHIGGSFDLLAQRHGAAQLRDIRRFTDGWEADASRQLRARDPAALAEYAMRSRIHAGTLDSVEADLFTAWRADALGVDAHGGRQSVLMIVGTNDQAAAMGERARIALIDAGLVDTDGPTVELRDSAASVGDHIVTRRNNRRLVTTAGGWVVNGDVWTVIEVHRNGAATVHRHGDDAKVRLPAGYLAEHAHLGYASTAHRAQGMTVDVCHALVDADASHQQLYVSATRGRAGNHLWVVLDSDRDLVRATGDLPAPEALLARILQRRDPDRLAAHQVIEDSHDHVGSLARLGAIYDDAVTQATSTWLRRLLADRGLDAAVNDRHWPALIDRLRTLALTGHDLQRLLDDTIAQRPIDDARSVAGVLHWRLAVHLEDATRSRRLGPAAAIPPIDHPTTEVARHAAELMAARWRALRHELTTGPAPAWAAPLGPRPDERAAARRWLTAATAIAAYRERYEVPDHQPLLGPRPAASRPDAHALYDHAQAAADRHLARRLRALDPDMLAELQARQRSILANPPRFDPDQLDTARRQLDAATRTLRTSPADSRSDAHQTVRATQAQVDRLERAAEVHRAWRTTAQMAEATCRQIALLQRDRTLVR